MEGPDQYEEKDRILEEGKVGDILSYMPNNQIGMYTSIIKLDPTTGNKIFVQISDYEGILGEGKKSKKTKKSKKSKKSKR